MRIIHARKRVFESGDYAFKHKLTLLVWILSILKWKAFGNTVVLYCDQETLNKIKTVGFDHLYDEIDTSLLAPNNHPEINFHLYWAMPKLLALKHEILNLGHNAVATDQDVVPMRDITSLWSLADVTVWSNKEFLENKHIYPEINELSLPSNYILPTWFTGKNKPLNTGVIHFRDREVARSYFSEVEKMSSNNLNPLNNSNCITMCNVEQRLLGELLVHKNLTYNVVQPGNQGLFNKNGFHTHGYKATVKHHNGLKWHLNLLLMIKKLDLEMFNKLIENELFKLEKNYFKINGYTCEELPELLQYKK